MTQNNKVAHYTVLNACPLPNIELFRLFFKQGEKYSG